MSHNKSYKGRQFRALKGIPSYDAFGGVRVPSLCEAPPLFANDSAIFDSRRIVPRNSQAGEPT